MEETTDQPKQGSENCNDDTIVCCRSHSYLDVIHKNIPITIKWLYVHPYMERNVHRNLESYKRESLVQSAYQTGPGDIHSDGILKP